MLLLELFASGDSMTDKMRNQIMNMLTPLLAHKVPFVTVQQVIDILNQAKLGIVIDRALVLSLLDPSEVDIIQKIEGDKIIFQGGEPVKDDEDKAPDEEEKQDQRVRTSAIDQAKKAAIAKNTPAGQ